MTQQWTSDVAPPARRQRPQLAVVTWSIIAVCAAVWLAELTLPGFTQQVVLSPALGQYEPWRYLTSAFAHSDDGIMHIAFNMFALWSVGQWMELSLGRARFAALYLICALGGGVGFLLLAQPSAASWNTGVVGASGAVFGLFGALLPMYRHIGASSRSMWGVLLLNAVISFTIPGIAWQAHLGGFLVGLACSQLMMTAVKRTWQGRPNRTWPWLGMVTVGLLVAMVAKYALV
ncbi:MULTISPECIES: rhomboid family intramembrane serine protease [unclassified Luteococcus]|uniref:rhomboid family intramembrane serine protease n=1 Tax=unclassified Luteococcus TaxID=2639923 RepID=UPI00313E498F